MKNRAIRDTERIYESFGLARKRGRRDFYLIPPSPFFRLATIRHRTKRSKGCLSRDGMLHMMFKLGQCAEGNWRELRGYNYLAKAIKGVQFIDGVEVTSDDQVAA